MAKKKEESQFDERLKRLEKLREKTNKSLKSLSDMSEIYNPSDYFDMGNIMLNLITGGHWKLGAPNNVGTMYIGDKDSGKSLLCLMKIKSAVDKGYIVYYFETEGAINLDKMREFGINTDYVVPIPTMEYEHLIGLKFYVDDLLNTEKLKDKSIFIFDSIVMVLDSEKFSKNKKEDETKTMGKHSQELNDFFKAILQKAALKHKAMDFVNRTYKAFDTGAANPKYATEEQKEVVSGGGAGQFAVSSILRVKKEIIYKKIKYKDEYTDKDKERKEPCATKFNISSARKNRVVKPGMDIYFIIDDRKGLLKYSGITPFAQQYGYLEKVRGGWKLKDNETVYKNPQSIPESEWERILENGFGDILNNAFAMPKLYKDKSEIIDDNEEYTSDEENELNDSDDAELDND